MEENIFKENGKERVGVMIVISVLITLYLFFIDEGYYSFNWMMEPGSWIVFVIYVALFTLVQFVLSSFFFKGMSNIRRNILVATIGLPLSLLLIYFLFNFIKS